MRTKCVVLEKTCKLCNITKEINEYYATKNVCKECYKARQNKRYHDKKEDNEIEYVKYISRGTQTEDLDEIVYIKYLSRGIQTDL